MYCNTYVFLLNHIAGTGVSNLFSSGARLKTVGAPRPEAKPKASLRRKAPKGGGWGRGLPPNPLPHVGVRGGLPLEIFGKLPQNGAFWCILEQLMQISKPKNLYEKNCVSLGKDFILDNKIFRFCFSNLL